MESPEYASCPETQDESDAGDPVLPVSQRDGRWQEVAVLAEFYQQRAAGKPLVDVARSQGIPESTLRHWVQRSRQSDTPASWSLLFESPEGLLLLHRIVVAALFVITQLCGGGIRLVCLFFEVSGLWRFVASGYGTQCIAVQQMEEAICQFGQQQREQLAAQMPEKPISLAEDETFHAGDTCLVASDAVSNFILVEQYAEDRKASTWDDAVEQGLAGLPVTPIQSVSDEGTSLLKHASQGLQVHHSPDLFHGQQDISRATSLPLQRNITQAQQQVEQTEKALMSVEQQAQAYSQYPRGPGRPPDFDSRINQARQAVTQAQSLLEDARQQRESVRTSARGISSSYHPFDIDTGELRNAATVENDLNEHFDAIEEEATEAGISSRSWALLRKARRLVPQMVGTIAFVHTMIQQQLEQLRDNLSVKQALLEYLIPLLYLKEVARKATTADGRDTLKHTCNRLRLRSGWAIAILDALAPQRRETLEFTARLCAQFFQRSSSNVEGRNGFLALRHHSLHSLPPRKLQALTVVHNYMVHRRTDGSTAAERFFEQSHDELFEYLLRTLPPPKRPAARRSPLRQHTVLN